ncbi:hypothetical protein F4825DRAFT_363922 [Nemania diffusa]|nr:hypothetical protein F4825DRAFT_363922 [Nemania diffusa]
MPVTDSMNSSVGPASAHDPPASDIYDPDEVFPQNSPLMKPRVLRLKPSPSPPAILHPLILPSQGDAVLISHLDGGRRPEISQEAGFRPLDQCNSEDDENQSGSESEGWGEEDGIRSNDMSPIPVPLSRFAKIVVEPSAPEPVSVPESDDLMSLATNALAVAAVSKTTDVDDLQSPTHEAQCSRKVSLAESLVVSRQRDMPVSNTKKPVLAAPMSSHYLGHSSPEIYSPPPQPTPGQVLMHPNNLRSPTNLPTGIHGELAPLLQMASPRSDSSIHETLPSIRSQFPEQLQSSPKDLAVRPSSHYPHSPPGIITGNYTSPVASPHGTYSNGLNMLSPAATVPSLSPHPRPYTVTNHQSPDYSSNGTKVDHSLINQGPTPPTERTVDRMSIDSMTNPPMGQFICNYSGCNAQPFQTQYLLNSHANVHSSARPHYCPVKGCPRSEGGKGFKRKNEMIRHGLVHDSPGYVCPFCPDREHKYPRPDNLQRHVRVHHVDKDKDDPALRDVLAQRPDGPNRGRRRRGGP